MQSGFGLLKEDICKDIMKAKTLTELQEKMNYIAEKYDLEEESN